jgi:hypothetical protein
MSEFTTGNLFLSKYSEQLQQMLGNSSVFLIKALNKQWSVLYFEDDWLQRTSTKEVVLSLSKRIPLLNFSDAEDHGWGYRIFANGEEQAQFYDDYSLDHGMVIDLAETRYPDIDVQPFLYLEEEGQRVFQQLLQEVRVSEQYQSAYAKQFEHKHVEAFSYFEIHSEKIDILNQLISPEGLQSEPPRSEEVSKFKKLVGITEMEWKSYHYTMLEQNHGQ